MNGAVDFVTVVQLDALHVSLHTRHYQVNYLINFFRSSGILVLPSGYCVERPQDE